MRRWLGALVLLAVAIPTGSTSLVLAATVPGPTAAVLTNVITLQVRSARNSTSPAPNAPKALQAIAHYRWLLNLDNTGEAELGKDNPLCHPSSNPVYPQGCSWPSIKYAVASPVLSEGTEADWALNRPLPAYNGTRGLPDACDWNGNPVMAGAPVGTFTKPCKYLVSVMADGFQIGGAHFKVPMGNSGVVNVFLNPYPVPLGTIRLKVFNDNAPADGVFNESTETGLMGFLGLVSDYDGIVSQDFFGNPLCTAYKTSPTTHLILLDANGRPTPLPAKNPAPPDPKTGYFNPTIPGRCLSDSNGDIVIPNMAPNRYSINVTPPDNATQNWIQTTTLEGNHDHDVWVLADDTGLDSELVVGGEQVPWVQFGYTAETPVPSAWACPTGGKVGETPGCGQIKGQIWGAVPYVPPMHGLPGVAGDNGASGIKLDRPLDRGWVSLNSLNVAPGDVDTMIASVPTDANGYFTFNNVPDGDYFMFVLDVPQEYLTGRVTITVNHGQVVDVGVFPLLGWFSHIYGHVFIDENGNGRMDPGEKGLFHALVQNLNRTNSAMEGGINTADTDNSGFYDFREAYPLGLMSINQFFNTRFKTTGVTWQACNDPQEHTVVAPMVDVSYMPVIGHCGRLDWGVQPYTPSATNSDNGGIVATVIYDEIRQKYNARQAQTFDYQTGMPGFRMEQYTPVKGVGPGGTDPMTGYALNANGSYQTVEPFTALDNNGCSALTIPCYMTENASKPAKCYPRDSNGKPIGYVAGDPKSYDFMIHGAACIESTAQSTQFGLGTDNPAIHGVQTVDGNYAMPGIPGGDALVRSVTPLDKVLPPDPATGLNRPLFVTTKEEDLNTSTGAQYIPQGADLSRVVWPPRAGPAKQMRTGNYEENEYTTAPGPDPQCAGLTHTVHVTNPFFLHEGGSPLEGQVRHDCATKLFHTAPGQSIAPNFHVHTAVDIPLPTHFLGYIVDDVSVETNRRSMNLGEIHGIPGVPIGIYDWTGRRNFSMNSDYNGLFEALMPSSETFNCPTPAKTCANTYRFVGNDPGQPAHPNLNYDPNYRTMAANFQAWPNMLVPADIAPWRIVSTVEGPSVQFSATSPCGVKDSEPLLFAVSPAPYTRSATSTLSVRGANFGTSGHVEFTPESTGLPQVLRQVGPWSDHLVQVTIGTNVTDVSNKQIPAGPGLLTVVSGVNDPTTGKPYRSTNGLTFHVVGGNYNPHIIEVGPGKQIDPFQMDPAHPGQLLHPFAIQDALERAATQWQNWGIAQVRAGRSVESVANDPNERYMVVVYPKWDPTGVRNLPFVPIGTYFENVVMHSPVKLQGVGPGGSYADPVSGQPTAVQGSIIDGRFWTQTTPGAVDAIEPPFDTANIPEGTTEPAMTHWLNITEAIDLSAQGTGLRPNSGGVAWTGSSGPLAEGAVVTILATTGTYNTKGFNAAIDGFTISGGDQGGFPGNISEVSASKTSRLPEPGLKDEVAGAVLTQGGAVFVNGGTDHFRITNNLLKQNNGAYGAIRFGTLFQSDPQAVGGISHNWNAAVSHNTFVANGGTNLAGAVGIFTDTVNYSIDHNTFCMNVATEYGGAISHHGYSPGGKISYNKMFLNTAYDEGGAITIAGEPPFTIFGGEHPIPNPTGITQGSGSVTIDHNYIVDNIAQDDGGALRIMGTAGTKGLSPITLTNNIISNNVSAHEGGAISLNDAPVVNIVNNTVANNVTTATAVTSNGSPAPAGVASSLNSRGLNELLQSRFASAIPAWMGVASWPNFSSPLIENDIFWDNRAGSWTPSGVAGIGLPGDTTAINRWDVGSVDGGALVRVRNSLLNTAPNTANQVFVNDGNNVFPAAAPMFVAPYVTQIDVVQQRTYYRFRPSAIIAVALHDNVLGDYHLSAGSPAQGIGVNPPDGVVVIDDIDGRPRPVAPGPIDAGAHQLTVSVMQRIGGPRI